MTHEKQGPLPPPSSFTHDELVVLNNALNEVCNGLAFGDDEFRTRIGYPREMVQGLLKKIATALGRKP